MKKFKKLIPAFCAMLVSAAMLGTSTYAWFSVNKEVTATDMSVTAVADTQYFLISTTADFSVEKLSTNLTAEQMTQKGIGDKAEVYPAAYGTVGAITEDSWYTANLDTDGTSIVKTTKITAPEGEGKMVYQNNQYFVGYSFYVGLAKNSADYNDHLKVLAVNSKNGAKIAAVQFQAMTGNTQPTEAGEFLPVEDTTASSTTGGLASTQKYVLSATAKKCVKITVYVFIDGGSANIKNGSTQLTGTVGIKVGASDIELTK